MEGADRWAALDAHLARDVRTYLEDRFWRPIEAQATLEVLRDDPSFFADPGRHPAMFADHGVVHARDVAVGLVRLIDTVDGVLLAARPPERRGFVKDYGVAAAYLHDIGMVDMSPVGRRTHPEHAAHAAFTPAVDPLVDHMLAPGGIRDRLDEVARQAPFGVSVDTVVRELLSLTAAHSKSTVPAPLLDDRPAFRRLMQEMLGTSMAEHRAAAAAALGETATGGDSRPADHPDVSAAFAWLVAGDGPQAELADDVIDAIRALRAADVLRQRGSALRTSGGYEICFDARTARAVCTMRSASGDAAYVVTYEDHRGAGEANLRVVFVTPRGDIRIAFHRGGFADDEAVGRAAASVASTILDIQADVIPSFEGVPARGLPPPSRPIADVRIQLERPDDDPNFADAVGAALASLDPSIARRIESVSNVEGAAAEERARYHAARPLEPDDPLVDEVIRELAAHGVETTGLDRAAAFAEVRIAAIRADEVLVESGSPPAFVYVPMGPGLIVSPGGGYAPSPLHAWVPTSTTGVIRRAGRNSDIVAERDVQVIMIPGERYTSAWLRPLWPETLRTRLREGATVA